MTGRGGNSLWVLTKKGHGGEGMVLARKASSFVFWVTLFFLFSLLGGSNLCFVTLFDLLFIFLFLALFYMIDCGLWFVVFFHIWVEWDEVVCILL